MLHAHPTTSNAICIEQAKVTSQPDGFTTRQKACRDFPSQWTMSFAGTKTAKKNMPHSPAVAKHPRKLQTAGEDKQPFLRCHYLMWYGKKSSKLQIPRKTWISPIISNCWVSLLKSHFLSCACKLSFFSSLSNVHTENPEKSARPAHFRKYKK